MIPLSTPDLSGNESKYLQECIRSTFVSYVGSFVTQFENSLAEITGAKGAVATSAGTTALHLALVTLGVKPGDLVIIPSLTFIATANSVAHAGATPWLLDVNESSWTLDPVVLEKTLAAETEKKGAQLFHRSTGKRVSAIMPVYTLGIPADMDAINAIAKKYGLVVIADAACALGASYKGKSLGSLADLSIFSFNGNKTLTSGGGGAIVGMDSSLLEKAKHLSTTAKVPGIEYVHDAVGFNYRMTNLQAAVGCAQLERSEALVGARKRIRQVYNRVVVKSPFLKALPQPAWAESACWLSGFTLESGKTDPLSICAQLKDQKIEARPFWKPIHLQAPYKNVPAGPCPVSEKIWKKTILLPSSSHLKQDEQNYVIKCFSQCLTASELQPS